MERLTRQFIKNNATRENALLLTVLRWYQIYKHKITEADVSCAACSTSYGCDRCILNFNLVCTNICNDNYSNKNIYRKLLCFAGFTSIKKYKASVPKKYHKFF